MAYIRRTAVASALAIAAFATESQAANWTGCHAAVAAGFTIVTPEPKTYSADGTQTGVAAGCDYQYDRVAFGAFVGYDWKSVEFGPAGAWTGERNATALTFGGRAGFLLGNDRDMFAYGLVAYTNVEVDDVDYESSGFAYGGGFESVVYRHWGGNLTLKGEVRRIDYDTKVDGYEGTETTATVGFAYHFAGAAPADDTFP
jgi:hypothetical protein